MTNSIQDLLELAKVDNSRKTTDKLAEALREAMAGFQNIKKQERQGGTAIELAIATNETIIKIQAIAEGKSNE